MQLRSSLTLNFSVLLIETRMKKIILILALTIPLTAGIIFTGHWSSTQKLKAAQAKVLFANRDQNAVQKDGDRVAQEAGNTKEWISFKSESEMKIRDHEIRINELKVKIKKEDGIFDAQYKKKIAYLEQQIKYVKVRLENYEKGPGNWESFKHGFINDMDAIENEFKNIAAENKK
jgi:hypothetical protein